MATGYRVVREAYAYGQKRVRLCVDDHPELPSIVRELWTYSEETARAAVARLEASDDPVALVDSWARPWNCECRGDGRVRLDNKPGQEPTIVHAKSGVDGDEVVVEKLARDKGWFVYKPPGGGVEAVGCWQPGSTGAWLGELARRQAGGEDGEEFHSPVV